MGLPHGDCDRTGMDHAYHDAQPSMELAVVCNRSRWRYCFPHHEEEEQPQEQKEKQLFANIRDRKAKKMVEESIKASRDNLIKELSAKEYKSISIINFLKNFKKTDKFDTLNAICNSLLRLLI